MKMPRSETEPMNFLFSLPHMRQLAPYAAVMLSVALALAAYLQVLHAPFLSDDELYITTNTRLVELPLSELWRLFIEPYNPFEFLPLRDLSYRFDIALFGLNSTWFRVHNILLYLLCLPLVYAITASLWRYFRPAEVASASWVAAIVTVLFVLHPAHVEAVVWISGRKDVLSGVFSLLALWLAVKAKREHGLVPRYATASLFALLAAMLSKATAVAVAPIIAMLWIIFWRDIPEQHRRRSELIWPLACLLLAACFTWFFTANSTVKEQVYWGVETAPRALSVLGWLARLSISPEGRHFFYPVFEDNRLTAMVALGGLVLLAAVAGMAMMLRKRSIEWFALVTFLLLCLPYTQLMPFLTNSLVSDRFLFLPVWPIMLLVVALVWRLQPVPRAILLLIIMLAWSFQTVDRPLDWRSREALVDSDSRAYPGHYLPAFQKIIGVQLQRGLNRDAAETARSIVAPEIRNVTIALISSDYAVRADAVDTGNPHNAVVRLQNLESLLAQPPVQIKWNTPMRHVWEYCRDALATQWNFLSRQFPNDVSVRYNAGLWMLKVKKYKEAIVHLRAATESQLIPESARGTAFKNFGLALMGAGNAAEAEAPLRAALQQSPPDFRAYCLLSDVYKRTGRIEYAARSEADCHRLAPRE
ncbi:MAG: hypothetical protein HY016_11815 [Nitrosomonadales bacterium]|nr:hypothetical protein [Nitrosomonadales bacterium]